MNRFRLCFLLAMMLLAACNGGSTLTPLPYSDDFSNASNGWKPVNDATLQIGYRDGALHFTINDLDQITWSVAGKRFQDFTLDVDAAQVDGPSDNSYGVLIRYVDEKNFYRLDISGDGYYAINKYQAGKWIKLQDWTESTAIKHDVAVNHLQVVARGSQFTFNVNGQPVTTFTDDEFKQGDVGLTAGTLFDHAGVHVAFDNLTVNP